MAFNNGFTAVTGATYTAAQYNTYVRDNFTALWPYTTAGDMMYATSATASARLAKVTGGILYGGASAPAYLSLTTGGVLYGGASAPVWLAKPGSDAVLKNTTAGTPSWLDLGYLKLISATLYDATGSTYSSTVERDLPYSAGSITLAVTSTILVIAKMQVSNGAGNCWSRFAVSIDGTTQNFVNFNYGDGISIPAVCIGRKTGVAAGARTIKVREKEGYGAGVTYTVSSVEWMAIAIPE